jgi:hypothetical protein
LEKLKTSLGAKENSTDYDEEEAISAAVKPESQPPSVMNLAMPKKAQQQPKAGVKRVRESVSEETSPSSNKRAKLSETSEQATEDLPKTTLSYSEIVKPFSALSVEQRTNVSADDDYSFTVDFY